MGKYGTSSFHELNNGLVELFKMFQDLFVLELIQNFAVCCLNVSKTEKTGYQRKLQLTFYQLMQNCSILGLGDTHERRLILVKYFRFIGLAFPSGSRSRDF